MHALRGRAQELDYLLQAVEDARAGSGAAVLLEGEAGIGKTRLIDETATRADALGMRVCRGDAEELEQDRPFGALLTALGAPDIAPGSASQSRWGADDVRFVVQDAFVDHVEHLAAAPLLLAFDDLQWADRATLTTVWALARRSRDMGLLLVVAFRATPAPPGLARVIEGCERIGARRISLGPIADEAVNDLALDVLGAPPSLGMLELLQGARGNPFVAIELLASISSDAPPVDLDDPDDLAGSRLPTGLRAALLRRFTGQSETVRRALPVAAVLGTAHVDDLCALLGISSAQAVALVAEATAAGLFEPAGDVVAFRHDLIREALYEDLPDAVRIGWHREAARVLQGRVEPAVVAQHLMLGAGRGDAEAIEGLRQAATDVQADTPDVAAALLERAIALTVDPPARADLAAARAGALLGAGRAEEAERQADDALAAPHATPEGRAHAHYARAQALTYQARFGEARTGYEQALAAGTLDEVSTAAVLAQQALHCVFTGALDEALDAADHATADGRRLGVTVAVCNAQFARCLVHTMRSDFDVAIGAGREAVALAEADPNVGSNDSLLGMALAAADRLDEARVATRTGRDRATARGEVLSLPTLQMTLAFIEWSVGRWDAALAEVDAMTGLAEDFGVRVGDPIGHGVVGNIAYHRGDRPAAEAALRAGQSVAERGGLIPRNLLARLSALMVEASGDTAGASSTLFEAYDLQRTLGLDAGRNMLGVECARLAVAAGTIETAEDLAADLAAYAARADTPTTRGSALYARGVIDRDGAMLEAAAAEFAAGGRSAHQLRAWEAAGSAFAGAGSRDEAVASLRVPLGITEELRASHDARRIAASLRDLGVRIGIREQPSRPTHGWDALTNAERDVAGLVGEGLRNREIADRLFVSRRTVETHVSRLYQKLDAATRVDLAAAIREHSERGTPGS